MKKYKVGIVLASMVFVLVGGTVAIAQAQGNDGNGGSGQDRMMETKAEVFGMTVEELETARETMNFEEIALQQGVNIDEMHAQMEAKAVARWQEKGFTDEEIAERVAVRAESRVAGSGPHSGGLGFGQGSNGMMKSGGGNGGCTQSEN